MTKDKKSELLRILLFAFIGFIIGLFFTKGLITETLKSLFELILN